MLPVNFSWTLGESTRHCNRGCRGGGLGTQARRDRQQTLVLGVALMPLGLVHEVRCTRSSRSGTRRVRRPLRPHRLMVDEWCQQTLRQACSQEYPGSARCVQSFDDSLDSASRKTYRISLRSSSLWEPRHPSLKVLQR